jgi:hypothetical protein
MRAAAQNDQIGAAQLEIINQAVAAPNGGSLRGYAKTQVALRDGFPVSPHPRLAEVTAAG